MLVTLLTKHFESALYLSKKVSCDLLEMVSLCANLNIEVKSSTFESKKRDSFDGCCCCCYCHRLRTYLATCAVHK